MLDEDYPTTFEQFLDRFGAEQDCADYIRRVRWPEGFKCENCGHDKAWLTARGLMHCARCRRDVSLTAGTVFESTRKPLRLWSLVMWLMMGQKTGVSAKNLKDLLGFGSYQTIWGWLHKLRSVMVRRGRQRLNGSVELDETYIGGRDIGRKGRGGETKTLVVIAVEVREKHLARVRLRCIPDASSDSLIPFAEDSIEPGSTVTTDGWKGYAPLSKHGYEHKVCAQNKAKDGEQTVLPNVHLVVLLLKRWLRGTHQAAVAPAHLQAYLNEFAFRFNRKLSTYRGKLFYRLMQQAVSGRVPGIKQFYIPEQTQHVVGG